MKMNLLNLKLKMLLGQIILICQNKWFISPKNLRKNSHQYKQHSNFSTQIKTIRLVKKNSKEG